jgi:cytidine deaminase
MPQPSPEECQKLLDLAREARRFAYAPYSKFAVGAAALTEQGKCICGANIENASYSLTICAERVTLFRALLSQVGKVTALAVSAGKGNPTRPCGACLQVMAELAPELYIILDDGANGYNIFTLPDLLPQPFSFRPKK